MGRYRDRSPWTKAFRSLLTGLGVLAWLYLVVGIIVNPAVMPSPGLRACAVVIGISLTLLYAYFNRRSQTSQLWRVQRKGPIRRRRWLRWLSERAAQTCPFCKDDLGDEVSECPGCEACYHPECLEEFKTCASLGCDELGKPEAHAPAKPSTKVSLVAPSDPASVARLQARKESA